MIWPKTTRLYHVPWDCEVEAHIVGVTRDMAERMRREWWEDECLKDQFEDPQPIDRHWDWNEDVIEYPPGNALRTEKVAIVAGPGDMVQGAMMFSPQPVASVLEPAKSAIFVELLFTAPRNRPRLRRDGRDYLRGVGSELLTWGAWFSRENGCDGRILLDGSPDWLPWYAKRGLQKLGMKPKLHEGVEYTPMELSSVGAQRLLTLWQAE